MQSERLVGWGAGRGCEGVVEGWGFGRSVTYVLYGLENYGIFGIVIDMHLVQI